MKIYNRDIWGIILVLLLIAGCAKRNEITVGDGDDYSYSRVGQIQTPGQGKDLAITDTLAFCADNETGLTVVSIRDKTNPYIITPYQTLLFPFGVDLFREEQIVITAEGTGDVGVYNYTDLDSIYSINTIYAQSAQDVFVTSFVDTNFADTASVFIFVADRVRNFIGYYVERYVDSYGNTIWAGIEISEISMAGTGQGIDYVDGFIFLASGEWGLHIIDARDLLNIELIGGNFGGIDTDGNALDVEVHGNYAYIADNQKGLQIIDVTDVANPIHLSNIDTADPMIDLAISEDGSRVFGATTTSGLYVFDVSDPINPQILQRHDTANARAVEADGDYVYIVDRYEGLIILKKS